LKRKSDAFQNIPLFPNYLMGQCSASEESGEERAREGFEGFLKDE